MLGNLVWPVYLPIFSTFKQQREPLHFVFSCENVQRWASVFVTVKRDFSNLIRAEICRDSIDKYNPTNQYIYIMYSVLFCNFLEILRRFEKIEDSSNPHITQPELTKSIKYSKRKRMPQLQTCYYKTVKFKSVAHKKSYSRYVFPPVL